MHQIIPVSTDKRFVTAVANNLMWWYFQRVLTCTSPVYATKLRPSPGQIRRTAVSISTLLFTGYPKSHVVVITIILHTIQIHVFLHWSMLNEHCSWSWAVASVGRQKKEKKKTERLYMLRLVYLIIVAHCRRKNISPIYSQHCNIENIFPDTRSTLISWKKSNHPCNHDR